MIRLFVRHTVNDYARWRRVYDDFNAEWAVMRFTNYAVHQEVGDPNGVTVTHDSLSMEAARTFVESARKEIMEAAGVAGPLSLWFTNPA
ncbi:MAG: cyclase [Thermomicrobiales bacterium]